MSQAGQWVTGSLSYVETLTGNNTGTPVGVDANQNINIIGTGSVQVEGNESTNTLTISVNDAGFTWNVIAISTATLVSGNGYIANYSGTCVMTLPSTASSIIGDTIKITGMNTNSGWKVAQNASQLINFSTITTTTGTSGYLESTYITDSIELLYIATNTWQVISAVGNIKYN